MIMQVLSTHAATLYAEWRSFKGCAMQTARLGYVCATGRGASDGLLFGVAAALSGRKTLFGVVQINSEADPDRPCHMDLAVLGTDAVIRISQFLGTGSSGCRLDTAGLETAVGLVETALLRAPPDLVPDLMIINKFGKLECDGRGFRPLIGQALAMGIPVLTSVSALNLPCFLDFAQDLATPLDPDPRTVLDWCVKGQSDTPR